LASDEGDSDERNPSQQPGDDGEHVRNIFACGSLRPDSDGPWTASFNTGTVSCKATLPGAHLFLDGYAAVKLSNTVDCCVRGYVLTADDKTFTAKLIRADRIEGYTGRLGDSNFCE